MRAVTFPNLLVVVLAILMACFARVAAALPPDDAQAHEFGTVIQGRVVTHVFALDNPGDTPLRIAQVQLTPPLRLERMPAVVPAAGSTEFALTLDTAKVEGAYMGALTVAFDDPSLPPRSFALSGKIVPEIEVRPRPAFFLSTTRGVEKSATLDIHNHGDAPLVLSLPGDAAAGYRLELQQVEAGRHYRLVATVPASAPAGRHAGYVRLPRTGGPPLQLGVNTTVRERVHAFPETLDFGVLRRADLADGRLAMQALMVYQVDGRDFAVAATTDIPGVRLQVEPGLQGDRASIVASLDPQTASGKLAGTVAVTTNDPAHPRLVIPVTGEIGSD